MREACAQSEWRRPLRTARDTVPMLHCHRPRGQPGKLCGQDGFCGRPFPGAEDVCMAGATSAEMLPKISCRPARLPEQDPDSRQWECVKPASRRLKESSCGRRQPAAVGTGSQMQKEASWQRAMNRNTQSHSWSPGSRAGLPLTRGSPSVYI